VLVRHVDPGDISTGTAIPDVDSSDIVRIDFHGGFLFRRLPDDWRKGGAKGGASGGKEAAGAGTGAGGTAPATSDDGDDDGDTFYDAEEDAAGAPAVGLSLPGVGLFTRTIRYRLSSAGVLTTK
jgi:hypothetical protein